MNNVRSFSAFAECCVVLDVIKPYKKIFLKPQNMSKSKIKSENPKKEKEMLTIYLHNCVRVSHFYDFSNFGYLIIRGTDPMVYGFVEFRVTIETRFFSEVAKWLHENLRKYFIRLDSFDHC